MATIADMQAYNMLQKIGPMNEGLAMGGEEEGGRSPYEPYKPAPTGPFVPPPKRKDKDLVMDFQDALPRGGFVGTKRTNVFINDGGEAYILKDGNFKFDGMYDPARHGPVFPRAQANNEMMIAKKKKKKELTFYEEAARRDAFRDMANEPYDPDTGRMGGGLDIMNDLLDGV